jgi:hypothetical protein
MGERQEPRAAVAANERSTTKKYNENETQKQRKKEKNTPKIKNKKYAPPTLPNAIANKLWLVNIHPHPESDIQP